MRERAEFLGVLGRGLMTGIGLVSLVSGLLSLVAWMPVARAGTTATSKATLTAGGNSAPTVTSVKVNDDSNVTLVANATTSVSMTATINDTDGCSDLNAGTSTILLFRSGVSSSSCNSTQNNLNCYKATAFTASSTCSTTSKNTTTTFEVWYFAEATDSSSSYPSQNWMGTVIFRDPQNATGTGDSQAGTTPDILTLTAINTTTSINYGNVSASSTTEATNQIATTTNAGNSSTTLQLKALNTLTKGSDSIPTSSQRYSTSSFAFVGTSTALTASDVTVSGFFLLAPTSTINVTQLLFWGLEVPAGSPTGTYNGTSTFTAVFQP